MSLGKLLASILHTDEHMSNFLCIRNHDPTEESVRLCTCKIGNFSQTFQAENLRQTERGMIFIQVLYTVVLNTLSLELHQVNIIYVVYVITFVQVV